MEIIFWPVFYVSRITISFFNKWILERLKNLLCTNSSINIKNKIYYSLKNT